MCVPAQAAFLAAAVTLLSALPSPARADVIRLSTGEKLTVSNLVVSGEHVEFVHPVLGQLKLARSAVEVLAEPAAAQAQPAAVPPQVQAPAAPPRADEAERTKVRAEGAARAEADYDRGKKDAADKAALDETSFLSGWKGGISLGANGAQGNTDSNSVRAGVGGRREAKSTDTRFDLNYSAAHENGAQSRNRGELNVLNDWIVKDSQWGYFADGKAEYDGFQDWTWRLSGHGGFTRKLIESPEETLRARAGVGAAKEIGGSKNEIQPEAILGGEWRRKLTDRQNVFVLGEYIPSFSAASDFRMNVKAGHEIVMDPQTGLSLKLGIENRFNSDPGPDFKGNDTEYFLLLGINF